MEQRWTVENMTEKFLWTVLKEKDPINDELKELEKRGLPEGRDQEDGE